MTDIWFGRDKDGDYGALTEHSGEELNLYAPGGLYLDRSAALELCNALGRWLWGESAESPESLAPSSDPRWQEISDDIRRIREIAEEAGKALARAELLKAQADAVEKSCGHSYVCVCRRLEG